MHVVSILLPEMGEKKAELTTLGCSKTASCIGSGASLPAHLQDISTAARISRLSALGGELVRGRHVA